MTDTVQYISLDNLEDHPDNPRLIWRDDVIDGIAAQLTETGHFDPAHALLVRPINGHYQIVRGHHRRRAADRVGFETVPCWVRPMDDDEAYMQLALGNVQGELSPLEIGVHALPIDFDRRGLGASGGGLKQYAKDLGQDAGNVTRYRNGAKVLINCNITINDGLLKKASHLAAIHGTPQELWPMLVEWVVDGDRSVNQTQDLVKTIKKYDIPEEWREALPLKDIVSFYLREERPTPKQIDVLVGLADETKRLIETHSERLGAERFPYTVGSFREWLSAGIGTYAWDESSLSEYRLDVIQAAKDADKPQPVDVQPGEWYRLGKHVLYCGDTGEEEFWSRLPQAAFAFADPPYNAGAAEWDHDFEWSHDWLIDKAPIVAVTPGIESIADFFRDETTMPYVWSMSFWIKNGMTRGKVGFGNWVYVALFSEGSVYKQAQDFLGEITIKTSETEDSDHKGRKPPELMLGIIDLFSESDECVIDPFLGSGTTLFAAEQLGRICYGGEVNPEFCNQIINRWQEETGIQVEKANADDI